MKRHEIIIRSLNGPLSKEEELFLSQWLAESKENKELYRKLELLNTAANMVEGYDEAARVAILRNMIKEIRREKLFGTPVKMWIAGIAASIIILVSVLVSDDSSPRMSMGDKACVAVNHVDTIFRDGGIVAYVEKVNPETESVKTGENRISTHREEKNVSNKEIEQKAKSELKAKMEPKVNEKSPMLQVTVPDKSIYTLYLPDSTKVLVRGGSTLSYPSEFAEKSREVQLVGEAFFDVVKNPKRPFIVKTRDVQSVVYGTKINVEAYPEQNYISTTLFSGVVEVNGVHLTPGMRAVKYSKDSNVNLEKVDLRGVDSWTRNEFYFNDVDLGTIIKELADCYGMKFIFENEELRKMNFTIICSRDKELTHIMGMLTKTEKIRFKITGNGIYIENK